MLQPLLLPLNNMRVILASGSKQRQEILARTPLKFEVCVSDFEENLDRKKLSISDYVEETALFKVTNVQEKLKKDARQPDLIIGVDTMIYCNGQVIGKPKDKDEAIDMLMTLTDNAETPHLVYTGVVLLFKGKIIKFTEKTTVYMEKLTLQEILAYVETGEPIGKAGAYAIQGLASSFVRKIEGDYYNVVGLPICRITSELKKLVSTEQ